MFSFIPDYLQNQMGKDIEKSGKRPWKTRNVMNSRSQTYEMPEQQETSKSRTNKKGRKPNAA